MVAVFPAGGQVGTVFDVAATGSDLDDAKLLFSHPGLFAQPRATEDPANRRFIVAVAPDVPPGVYDLRIAGRFGVSNPRRFTVGLAAEKTLADGSSTSPGGAVEALGLVLNARATAGGVNHHPFELRKGERTLFECAATEIDSRLAPVMALFDPQGREVARSRRGGLVDFTPTADGRYDLAVNDLLYRGGPEFAYRLRTGSGPHVDFILPPTRPSSGKSSHILFGRNLPGGAPAGFQSGGKPLEKLDIEIDFPAQLIAQTQLLSSLAAGLDGFHYHRVFNGRDANPMSLQFGDVTTTSAPTEEAADAQPTRLSPPADVCGRFKPRGGVSRFTLSAKKGEPLWIESVSHRIGEPSGPFLLIQRVVKDDAGKERLEDVKEAYGADADAAAGFGGVSRDFAFKFDPPADGEYRLSLRDAFGAGSDDATRVYRLCIHRPKPDYRLIAQPIAPPNTPATVSTFLRKGSVFPLRVTAMRLEGFDGDIALEAKDLPAGVTCVAETLRAGEKTATLLLQANDSIAAWAGAITIAGKAKVAEADVSHTAVAATGVWPDAPAESRLTRQYFVGLSGDESEPIVFETPKEQPLEAVTGSKLTIPLKLNRRLPINGTAKLRVANLARNDAVKEVAFDGAAEQAATSVEVNLQDAPPGERMIYFAGEAQVKYARGPDKSKTQDVGLAFYSPPVRLRIAPKPPAEKK